MLQAHSENNTRKRYKVDSRFLSHGTASAACTESVPPDCISLRKKTWAKEHAAEKLYISDHSAVESQAFYRSMGCVEAKEHNRAHVEKEPWDCQLECVLLLPAFCGQIGIRGGT